MLKVYSFCLNIYDKSKIKGGACQMRRLVEWRLWRAVGPSSRKCCTCSSSARKPQKMLIQVVCECQAGRNGISLKYIQHIDVM